MPTFLDLQSFFLDQDIHLIIAADAEPFFHTKIKNKIIAQVPAGGVAVALDPVAKAAHSIFIARGKTSSDKEVVDTKGKIKNLDNSYTLKRLFFSQDELDAYYYGFSNQTLWPLCHAAFERPIFSKEWFEGYCLVNQTFAKAILEEIKPKTVIWINDYQLAMVPKFLNKPKSAAIGFFWHIPWPTWEIFRVLPQKIELLESLLQCDFVAFHRNYQAKNFLNCVERELEARIDLETRKIYYKNHVTTVNYLPMGIDTDVIKSLVTPEITSNFVKMLLTKTVGMVKAHSHPKLKNLFSKHKVMLGVDRLDYTKGILLRIQAIDIFFTKYPKYKGNVTYAGILSPSREEIPAYIDLRKQLLELIEEINTKHKKKYWQPINLIMETFTRKEIINWYKKADLCLVTPLDDGMNLVSKEYVLAATQGQKHGMLVLSQFAGSAIDLTQALIVNPYNTEEVALAIKIGLDMSLPEKQKRLHAMAKILEERNVYEWAQDFIKQTQTASIDNQASG